MAHHTVKNAKKKLKAEFEKARVNLAKHEKQLAEYIKKNPKKAIAISAGLGAVIAGGIAAAIIKHKKKKRWL